MIDIILFGSSVFFILLGLAGSVLPIIPGPLTSWVGLLLLHLTKGVEMNLNFILLTAGVAILIFVLDLVMPLLGTKKYGGSKGAITGCTIGMIVGICTLGPPGLIIGPFFGALIGEYFTNRINSSVESSFRVAVGAFVGFLLGTILKIIVGVVFLYYFIKITIDNWGTLF
ncbi:MAG: DUF456 domain-containing protein [Flavobacteriaceae bacterium]|nr:DUF456 domain-containing protein [Flavobacteriaceae bacterium]